MEVQYIHFSKIDSTNTYAKNHFAQFDSKKITCITADEQTHGQGRHARAWVSQKGNLHMTLFFSLPSSSTSFPNLAQLLAFSFAEILVDKQISVAIKWPNDLLVENKKLSGAMAEIFPWGTVFGVILAIGVNVNTPVQTDQPTISLFEITSHEWDLVDLREKILHQFQTNLEIYIKNGFGFFHNSFSSLLAYKTKKISCTIGNQVIEGVLEELTEEGHVKIHCSEGKILTLCSGDIKNLRQG